MALAQYQGPGRGVRTHGRFVSREEIANRMYQLAGGKAAYRFRASPTTSSEQCLAVGENGGPGIRYSTAGARLTSSTTYMPATVNRSTIQGIRGRRMTGFARVTQRLFRLRNQLCFVEVD